MSEESNTRFTHALLIMSVMLLCELLDRGGWWELHFLWLIGLSLLYAASTSIANWLERWRAHKRLAIPRHGDFQWQERKMAYSSEKAGATVAIAATATGTIESFDQTLSRLEALVERVTSAGDKISGSRPSPVTDGNPSPPPASLIGQIQVRRDRLARNVDRLENELQRLENGL